MSGISVFLITMKSPGGRSYRFSMEKSKINQETIQNPKMMKAYLENLKQQGLKPQKNTEAKNERVRAEEFHKKKISVQKISQREEQGSHEIRQIQKLASVPQSSGLQQGSKSIHANIKKRNNNKDQIVSDCEVVTNYEIVKDYETLVENNDIYNNIERESEREQEHTEHRPQIDGYTVTKQTVSKSVKRGITNNNLPNENRNKQNASQDLRDYEVVMQYYDTDNTEKESEMEQGSEMEQEQGECRPQIIGHHVYGASKTNNKRSVTKCNPPKEKKKKPLKDCRVQDLVEDEDLIYDVERTILEGVLKRPPLFNYKLDPKERSPDLKLKLFEEIAMLIDEIYGAYEVIISAKQAENTWNQHREHYVEYTNKLKLPSGSGGNREPCAPKHYELLQQLESTYEHRNQFSSTSAEGFELQPPKGKKDKMNDEIIPLMKSATKLLSDLSNKSTSTQPAAPPQPSQNLLLSSDDRHTAFFSSILPDIRKLNDQDERDFKIMILNKLNEYLRS